jgi:signal transduction histidine kinase
MGAPRKILVVDDEPRGVELLERCLRTLGEVQTAGSGEAGWEAARLGGFDLIITDQRMPGLSGVELLTRVAEHSPDTGRVLITGYTDLESTIDAINRGQVHAYLTKPCAPEQLRVTARSVLEKLELARDNDRLVADLSAKNQELEETLASLEAAQQHIIDSERLAAIGRMIAMIVHDLRTPLQVILSSGNLLGLDSADDDVPGPRELGHEIVTEAERMQRICADLLDVTRASQGSARRLEDDLDEVLETALAHVVEDASRLGIEVHMELASGARLPIDEDQLRRAIQNLASNAVEAMPEGGSLRVLSERLEDAVRVAVIDTGVGIPDDIRDSVFDPFVTSGKPRGTGLGLAIVKKIVEDHGGRIQVAKPEGGGTAFEIRLPI